MKKNRIKLTQELVLHRMMSWCAYQERSQDEARKKMYNFDLEPEEIDGIIAALISENYLNEERFATAFAGGKFRIKQWGKGKIKAGLRSHKVSDYSIKKALITIDGEEYENTIIKTIEKKLRTITSADSNKKYYSTLTYMVSRGFESDLVAEQLNNILHKKST